MVKIDGSKRDMIDTGIIEIAMVEGAIDKNHPNKITPGKITMVENAGFKFL